MDVDIKITDLGQKAGYFADKFVANLITKVDPSRAMPEHVRLQAIAQRDTVRDMALWFIDRAINSDRYRIAKELRIRGHLEAASYVETGVVYDT